MTSSPKNRIGCWFSTLLERKRSQNIGLTAQFGANAQSALDAPEISLPGSRRGSLTRDGLTLADLHPGECGYISRLIGTTQGRLRLLEMGMTPGTHVQVTRIAAFGGPLDVQVRGYQLSLRRDEAAAVWLGGTPETETELDADSENSIVRNCEEAPASEPSESIIMAARERDNLG